MGGVWVVKVILCEKLDVGKPEWMGGGYSVPGGVERERKGWCGRLASTHAHSLDFFFLS